MSNGCGFCGQQGHNVDHCPERLEAYHGRPADQDLDLWVLGADGDVWHAAGSFNGHEHACLCGTDVETPLEWSTEDLRWAPDRYADVPVCRECVATLEGTRAETVPDDVAFQTAREIVTDGGEEVDRFTDLPVPDRFFLQISSAEIDYRVEDWERDEIRFSAQNVPGGKFGFEIAAAYSYAGYDCKQHFLLDVEGAVALRKALGEALEARGYDPETGEREIVTDGGQCVDDTEAEAEALVELFNEAAADHSPDLEWFAMGLVHESMEKCFVLEAQEYIDPDGLDALRDAGRTVRYIEAYQKPPKDEVYCQIEIPVHGDRGRTLHTDTDDEDVQTDGGLEEIFRRETIVATDDGIAVGDAAVPRSRTREGGDN
ncbi:hypothetical protein [Natrarchaeobaculum sulfurireducens]|nr:hypothetical protein [Natrarchaeobaculum sulfurireducens]